MIEAPYQAEVRRLFDRSIYQEPVFGYVGTTVQDMVVLANTGRLPFIDTISYPPDDYLLVCTIGIGRSILETFREGFEERSTAENLDLARNIAAIGMIDSPIPLSDRISAAETRLEALMPQVDEWNDCNDWKKIALGGAYLYAEDFQQDAYLREHLSFKPTDRYFHLLFSEDGHQEEYRAQFLENEGVRNGLTDESLRTLIDAAIHNAHGIILSIPPSVKDAPEFEDVGDDGVGDGYIKSPNGFPLEHIAGARAVSSYECKLLRERLGIEATPMR